MTAKTKIEWTQETWNPIAGCSVISSGCDNCYAMQMAYRLEAMGLDKYQGTTRKNASGRTLWTGEIKFDEKALMKPLSWKDPRRIFVNSMSDLFHEDVQNEWIDQIFSVMALCPQHTFQILTKRPERMRDYIMSRDNVIHQKYSNVRGSYTIGFLTKYLTTDPTLNNPKYRKLHDNGHIWQVWQETLSNPAAERLYARWPLPNVWLGVSVEDQKTAEERIPFLLDTPAAVRWISAEPLLGMIDLTRIWAKMPSGGKCLCNTLRRNCDDNLDWVVVGGESGPNARPMHPEGPRSLRDQCKGTNVPFFFKQWGEWLSVYDRDKDDPGWRRIPESKDNNTRFINLEGGHGFHGQKVHFIAKVGKKAAGHLLDGEVIQQYPGDVVCPYCNGEGEIETDNNGPIVSCPICEDTTDE
ncbi:MAG: hypothetical protein COB49_07505 [Alphaproteobacteria bacterium]|nr:MAG: hypothetical protein COB49_07505 [Alphaproteobacteria bacterium]